MSEMTVGEVMDYIEENDVKFIRLAFCDYHGVQKNVSVMPDEFSTAIKRGEKFDSFRIAGYGDPDHGDLFLKPDISTLCILPWRPQEGRVVRLYCDVVTADGEPYALDPRKLLRDTVEECKKAGIRPRIGLRSEFYLFRTDDDDNPTDIPWDQGGYCDIAPFDGSENIRREICLTMEEMGIQPQKSYHESGPGQNEIDFGADSALRTAENFITYKNVVGAVSARNGIFASFDPKPIPNESGNGLHLKVSLFRNGENLWDEDPAAAEGFAAGVLNRMKDITVFLNSQKESYDRFGQGEAPKYITWSKKSGSRLLRIPENGGRPDGFILRSPDSSLNPYLAFSVILRAGLEGVKRGEKLPEPVENSGEHTGSTLPMSLSEAIDCARDSEFLQSDAGLEAVVQRFLNVLSHEGKEGL